MFFIQTTDLPEALHIWSQRYALFTPQGKDANVHFLPYDGQGYDPSSYINTAMSPKDFVFKEREALFSWEKKEGEPKEQVLVAQQPRLKQAPHRHSEDTLLFGVRPCDTYGLAYMDRFFLSEYKDLNYAMHRHHLFVAAVNCLQFGSQCFCTLNEETTGPFAQTGYDILLTPDGDRYWLEESTEKGQYLLAVIMHLLHTDYEAKGQERKAALLQEVKAHSKPLPDHKLLQTALAATFDHPLWENVAHGCISCTGCTRVCPTCTCFTTDEENTMRGPSPSAGINASSTGGTRVRHWDSCQAHSFTRNAEWHNPRTHTGAVRYRIYDKLKYIEERFGMKGCTGCGRCSVCCPAAIDILDVATKVMAAYQPNEAEHTPCKCKVPFEREDRDFDPGLYTPNLAEIIDIYDESSSIRRFTIRFTEKVHQGSPALRGQFYMLTDFGVGEVAISVSFSDKVREEFCFYIKKVGKVTTSLFTRKVGDLLGVRGPFGVPLPYETIKGRDLIVVGSGVGQAPVRATLIRAIENKDEFGKIVVIGSALTYDDLVLKEDLKAWSTIDGVQVVYAFAKPTDKVEAHVGYINDLLPNLGLDWHNTTAIVCASARRIKAVAKDLMRLGMQPKDIYTALETNMRCGVGKCGHCKVGAHYMCVDGPVFTYEEMLQLPPEF